jgi:hypothetical protein
MATPSQPKCYNPRHPERTLLYQTVAEHYKTWLDLASACQFDGQGDHHADTVGQVQAILYKPSLHAFVGQGLLESFEAKEMLAYLHSGFSGVPGATRRWAMVSMGSQIGTRRHNRHRMMRLINASVGKGWQQRFCQRCGAVLRLPLPKNVQTEKSRATGPEQVLRQTQLEGL